ncbi:Membrane protein involved in aromatic hydrocarbon degradation [Candidatus Magnetobacterium bavaricum]|uniref:Membrane protein involved in aromatic hydrocarbon degradation n=1 Tax=Candidatus Magnetobacterium bavaricum TaxID=29290 RepID=A0A0F3GM85_9BACT|nr:Membrane protein involved in aromatic hydrocarbon degradation [Candidatus Magnetobacterium bavaricum]
MEGLKKSAFNLLLSMTLLMFLTAPTELFAITNSYEWAYTDFSFTPPGARAGGMGGAFVALADDATCAVSNPAGLAQLPRTQIAIEGTFRDHDTHGRAFIADNAMTQTTDQWNIRDNMSLSFGSFSTALFNNFIHVSLFYNRLTNSHLKFASNVDTGYKYEGFNKLSVDEYGLSMAKGFFGDKLFIGAGASVDSFGLKSGFDLNPTNRMYDRSSGYGVKLAYRVGVLYVPFEALRFGINYARMPGFNYDTTYAVPGNYGGGVSLATNTFNIPDTLSLGVAVKPTQRWTIITEGKYVKYSDIMKDFRVPYALDNGNTEPASNFEIKDRWEFHLGTEYVFDLKDTPVAIRLGTYYDPRHGLYAKEGSLFHGIATGGEDIWHYTGGVGTVLFNHWQIDAAIDLARDKDRYILSMVYQF